MNQEYLRILAKSAYFAESLTFFRPPSDGSERAPLAITQSHMSANPSELLTAYIGLNRPAELESSAVHPERRRRARTKLHWPVLFFRHHAPEAVESLTQDLSSGGFYCLSKTPFTSGERILCTLKIPTYDPGGKQRERTLECEVRVMRVEAGMEDNLYGIACRIDDYRFAHPNSTVAH